MARGPAARAGERGGVGHGPERLPGGALPRRPHGEHRGEGARGRGLEAPAAVAGCGRPACGGAPIPEGVAAAAAARRPPFPVPYPVVCLLAAEFLKKGETEAALVAMLSV
eukprot:7795373-Alexandrium_andersonii.AAC.1